MWRANKKRELEMEKQVQILHRDLVLIEQSGRLQRESKNIFVCMRSPRPPLVAVAKLPGWQGVAAATPQKMLATPLATQVVRSVSNIHLLNGIIFFATEAVDLIGNLFKFKN